MKSLPATRSAGVRGSMIVGHGNATGSRGSTINPQLMATASRGSTTDVTGGAEAPSDEEGPSKNGNPDSLTGGTIKTRRSHVFFLPKCCRSVFLSLFLFLNQDVAYIP